MSDPSDGPRERRDNSSSPLHVTGARRSPISPRALSREERHRGDKIMMGRRRRRGVVDQSPPSEYEGVPLVGRGSSSKRSLSRVAGETRLRGAPYLRALGPLGGTHLGRPGRRSKKGLGHGNSPYAQYVNQWSYWDSPPRTAEKYVD